MTEPENLVLQLLREMRADMATKADVLRLEKRLENKIADVDAKVMSLAADVASGPSHPRKAAFRADRRFAARGDGISLDRHRPRRFCLPRSKSACARSSGT